MEENMLSNSKLWRALTILVLLALFVIPFSPNGRALASQPKQAEGPTENGSGVKPGVSSSLKNDISPALRDMKPAESGPGLTREIPLRTIPRVTGTETESQPGTPAVVQDKPVVPNMPAPIANFEGTNNVDGVLPPDTEGDIGYDPATGTKYYMQWNNLSLQIWDVTNPAAPVSLYGPVTGNTLFSGFGGPCQTTNHGDPIVLFDHLANRWLASQFSVSGPFYECIAISQTADPTGPWYRYAFLISNTKMNDYPKFGVWPDGYYMSVNQFTGSSWAGAGAVVFERDAMLVGDPATMVYFDVGAVNINFGGMLPSDLDGTPPPAGTPNFFAEWDDSSWLGDPQDTLRIWEFHVDWINPANSTFGLNASYTPNYTISTSNVDPNMCNYLRNCIPQPGGTAVDAISDRLMYRLQYRNFGTHQALVSNHTVDASGSNRAGVHWFELRNSGAGWVLYQDGVYAPGSEHRWMGSVALDVAGNMALGYSVSSVSVFPSIRYTGRLAGDPLNTLPQGEAVLIAGGGSQSHSSGRWGDYSMMGVDPVDQCTFWYTQEYYASNSLAGWRTRVGSFKYPSCSTTGTLQGTVTDAATSNPIAGAQVSLGGGLLASTDAAGFYSISNIPVGLYDATASKSGYVSVTVSGVEILAGTTTVQDFVLAEAADLAVSLAGTPDPVFTGELLTYTVTVDNLSTPTATGVEVGMTLPVDVELVEVSGACTSLPCNLGTLAGGAQAEFQVVVRVGPMAASPLVAVAEVSATTTDPNLGNNTVSLETEVDYQLFLPLIVKSGEE